MTITTTTAGGRVRFLAGRLRRALAVVGVAGVLVTACGGPSPEVPLGPDGQPDAVLEAGRTVYGAQCSNCHGNEGQGGRGKPQPRYERQNVTLQPGERKRVSVVRTLEPEHVLRLDAVLQQDVGVQLQASG